MSIYFCLYKNCVFKFFLNLYQKASNIPQCIHGDNICIKNAINEIVGLAQNGIPELNLIPLDPLHVDFINIIQGENENSPVNLALKLINIDVLGMGQLKTNKIL